MTATTGQPLAIIAGSGALPLHVAAAAQSQGRPVFIVGIEGEADPRIGEFDHAWANWGQVGSVQKMIAGRGARDVVLIGGIRARPDLRKMKLDLATLGLLKELLAILVGGDNKVLSGAIRFFERRGFRVVGAHEVASDLVAAPGRLGAVAPTTAQSEDIRHALHAARTIGALDAGQAAVAVDGHVIALEGYEGTDAMIARAGELRERKRVSWEGRAGAVAKCAKPQQDLRVDMPTIGPGTVAAAAAAGLAGIAIEAGRVMIAERDETIRRADAVGLFVVGVAWNTPAAQ
jgi:DUF1009 family protein